jgi:aspartate carbamoyltransferase catalytic subunit
MNSLKNKSLVSINDFTPEEIKFILQTAARFEETPPRSILSDMVIGALFFEPSTRTRLSFESAVKRLGGRIIGFAEAGSSSVTKGESLKDTILTVSNYSDLIVMRHSLEGSARYASEVSPVPIINAGDGANQHPTQTLLDLYSILKTQGTLNGLNIFMVGDLKYGRTVHSLLIALSNYNTTFNFISPAELRMPDEYKLILEKKGLKYYEHDDFTDIISRADIVYMTRVQRERFSDPLEYEKVKNIYVLRNETLEGTKPNLRILHPLPRVNEIEPEVDENPKAYYFEQALNGVYVRQAIIATILDMI